MILTDNTKQILQDIKYFGGTISLKDDNLKLSFPDDFSNPDLLERIKINKSSLINFLVNENCITPTLKQTDFKATPGQKGLWFLSQFEEGSNAYHITTVFDLIGEVNPIFLEKSFQILMDRHEILRTTFYSDEEGELYQQIHEKGRLNLAFNCCEEHDFSKQEELIKTYGNALFDLGKDSLFRSVLIKIDEKDYILSLTFHHIISDGWSVSVLIKELLHIYDQLSKGGNVVLPELKIQYKDYAVWQRDRVSKMELSRSYWKDKLSGELPTLDLLGYQTRPPVKTYVGDRVLLSIDKDKAEKWKGICNQNSATLFMGLLTGLNAVLFRYTSQQDFIIGTATAGRIHQDVINQIGFYVNTLPLRTKVTSESSFLDLLSEVKETTLEAFENYLYPFDNICEELQILKDTSRSPLFDCMMVLQNNEKIELVSSDFNVTQRENTSKTSKYDLSFLFTERKDGTLDLELEFNTDIYDVSFVNRLSNHYVALMDTMLINNTIPISNLDYLSNIEKTQLLFDFNNTKVDYSGDKTIVDLFNEQVEKKPNAIAIEIDNKKLTYIELNKIANQLANYLLDKYDIVSDDLIGIEMDRNENFIISLLGILKSGAAYVPIDSSYPVQRIEFIKSNSDFKTIINNEEFTKISSELLFYSDQNVNVKINNSSLIYVIYTSGSTGTPKGIMMEHKSMFNLIQFHNDEFKHLGVKKVSQFTSVSFDVSFQEIITTLTCGGILFPVSEVVKKSMSELLSFLKNKDIDTMFLPTAYFKLLTETEEYFELHKSGSLKNIIVAGERLILSNKVISKLKVIDAYIHNHYGPTETHVVTTITLNNKLLIEYPTIGHPISNTQLYILDDRLQVLPLGAVGKLYVSGISLARGYLNQPELTSEKFINNPYIEGKYMYDTGDIARWLPDGNIEFFGRKDNQVKLRGYRIELGEIEHALLGHDDVVSALVLSITNNLSENELVAYIVKSKGSEISTSELIRYLHIHLPTYMVPYNFVVLNSMPLTSNGKIDLKSLQNFKKSKLSSKNEYAAPRNKVEKQLVKIWQDVLGIKYKISIYDNFFILGGHSLKVIKLVSLIDKKFNLKIEIEKVFKNPTIENLALIIENENGLRDLNNLKVVKKIIV